MNKEVMMRAKEIINEQIIEWACKEGMTDELDKVKEQITREITTILLPDIADRKRRDRARGRILSIPIPVKPERECDCVGGERFAGCMGFGCPTCKGTKIVPAEYMALEEIIKEKIKNG